MDNPFVPAEWGAIYDLAGAVWRSVHDLPHSEHGAYLNGTIVVSMKNWRGDHDGRIWRISGRGTDWPPNDKHAEEYGWSICKPGHNALLNHVTILPLLPSPDWVNAQSDPRAVAIAALERAGFDECNSPAMYTVILDRSNSSSITLCNPAKPVMALDIEDCTDPTLSRYAQDCFEVLHAWAAAINWEVHDDT